MKRALQKKEKAVMENTPSDDVPVEQQAVMNTKVNHRMPKKAAMIGLAISMGATSLLVTRQSDQALAAEPVGNQNTASSLPAAPDAAVKFAPKNLLEPQAVSSVSVPENPAVVEPTAISQVPGLGAKLQVTASGKPAQASAPSIVINNQSQVLKELNTPAAKADWQFSPTLGEQVQLPKNKYGFTEARQPVSLPSQQIEETGAASEEVNAQLKAQQEFALNRLQEKSNRLRESLAELRSEESTGLSAVVEEVPQKAVVEEQPQVSTTGSTALQLRNTANDSQVSLVSRLKQSRAAKASAPITQPTVAAPVVVSQTAAAIYEVKPGDTLAAIASSYGTTVQELARANKLVNPNQLHISQQLTIPVVERRVTDSEFVTADNTTQSKPTEVVHQQIQPVVTVASTTPVVSSAPNIDSSLGMGGDAPVPRIFSEMQQRRAGVNRAKNSKNNQRLQNLQKEIERLREKYRAQQSGDPVVIPEADTQPARAVTPVVNTNNAAIEIPVAPSNRQAVPIPVPRPLDYSAQPVKPQYRAIQSGNEPVNPEFRSTNNSRSRNQRNKVATPSVGVVDTNAESLGTMRGAMVSPSLPPLAAVDRYLPKPIDETTTVAEGYIWPAKGVLTSGFGPRWGRMHKGIDIANATGTPIHAAGEGVVERAGWNNGGYGNLVDIRHPDGTLTRYAHNSKILVRQGQFVQQGQPISAMGSTGFSTGPHLHFELHPPGRGAVNPIAFLPNRL